MVNARAPTVDVRVVLKYLLKYYMSKLKATFSRIATHFSTFSSPVNISSRSRAFS